MFISAKMTRLRVAPIGVAALAVLLLGACREQEQNRPLSYDKGTYQGSPDTTLNDAELRELQQRGQMQKF